MIWNIYRDGTLFGLRKIIVELYVSGADTPIVRTKMLNRPRFLLRGAIDRRKARMVKDCALYLNKMGV